MNKEREINLVKAWLKRARALHAAGYNNRAHFWLNAAARKRRELSK